MSAYAWRAAPPTRLRRQVQRVLPRTCRLFARERRVGAGSSESRQRRRPTASAGSRSSSLYNDLESVAALSNATARGWRRYLSSRSRATWASCRPRPASSRASRVLRPPRRAARLRRGDDRLPRRARRVARALRRAARPDDPREDRRRRAAAAAFGGRADLMERLAPAGDVYQAGTLSGTRSPPPRASRCCAGCATSRLRGARAERRTPRGRPRPVRPRAAGRGDGHALPRRRPADRASNFADADGAPTRRYGASSATCSSAGIYIAPSQFECLFVSSAHGDEDIDCTIPAVGEFFGNN